MKEKIRYFLYTCAINFFSTLEKWGYPWYRMPKYLAILAILIYRERLRRFNLFSLKENGITDKPPLETSSPPLEHCGRTLTGAYTDIQKPCMGMAGTAFSRSVPPAFRYADPPDWLMSPNPREISLKLLARNQFLPATSLNLLAAAWIQFQVHGWVRHTHDRSHWLEIPISADDPWPYQKPMQIPSSLAETNSVKGEQPSFINNLSHWWDGAQIYGYNEETSKKLRSFQEGKLKILPNGLLPVDPKDNIDITGMRDNWWVGLSLLHTLFTLEHNAICDQLHATYPAWPDDALYRTARLINSALMAKIHTVEWTPAILNTPVLHLGLNANWFGLEKLGYHFLSNLINDKVIAEGILGSQTNYHGVDYSLSEEFVSVYRLHPLIPDLITFSSVQDGSFIEKRPMLDLAKGNARLQIQDHIPMADLFYSFGIEYPGEVSLHNYPDFLRDLEPQPLNPGDPQGPRIDLAAIDILRDRERGVPRYNLFRKAFGLPCARTFEELTGGNTELAAEIRDVYQNIDRVDLMVGLFAEPKPPGFGFSDTAFRLFILLATRRLEADRFYTTDYNSKIYTAVGIEWVEKNTMQTVLLRHYPELLPSLKNVDNAFAPWGKVNVC